VDLKGSIRAVNSCISSFIDTHRFGVDDSAARSLVFQRLCAKFELPAVDKADKRRQDAWERWINYDSNLPERGILGPYWAKARLWVHETLSGFRMGDLAFTNGSSFEPLGSATSLACKLSAEWTITSDCFDLFARYSYWHRGLKMAVKKRFKRYCTKQVLTERAINQILWSRFGSKKDPAFEIYKFKLFCVVKFVRGNRWSTVPKNNLKDRSICLEPLCNMLVQRAVGLGLRKSLQETRAIDLDHLADVHRNRISDVNVATIDLADCSDTISVRLINYLLPYHVLKYVHSSRSDMTLGPDDDYYVVKKVSSMGNGFTFDLMTVILTALTRSVDEESSVFGDDIICQNQHADLIIENLKIAGFDINLKKTNIRSTYRESCGAHFVDGHGYVTSFDFRWVNTVNDLVVTLNKVAILESIYGDPYSSLRSKIWTCVPRILLGVAVKRHTVDKGRPPSYNLDGYVRYGPTEQVDPARGCLKGIRRLILPLHKTGRVSIAIGFEEKSQPASSDLHSSAWDIYLQYISYGRRVRKFKKLVLKPSLVARLDEEQIGFINYLRPKQLALQPTIRE